MANSILVWVVDDDESIRWVLEKGLSEHNIEVELFESAHQVILKLESENPDLILTDIKMPGTSGIDLLDQVQNLRPEIPVIIITIGDYDNIYQESLKSEDFDFILIFWDLNINLDKDLSLTNSKSSFRSIVILKLEKFLGFCIS